MGEECALASMTPLFEIGSIEYNTGYLIGGTQFNSNDFFSSLSLFENILNCVDTILKKFLLITTLTLYYLYG